MILQRRDLLYAPLVPAALERRRKPERGNFVGQTERDDATAHGENVRIIVLARHARCIEVVTEGRPYATNLVGRHLFTLTAAAKYDSAVDASVGNGAGDIGADRRIVNRMIREGSAIVDIVAKTRQRRHQMFLQRETRVVRTDRDTHDRRL